jgi:hypothetical protein
MTTVEEILSLTRSMLNQTTFPRILRDCSSAKAVIDLETECSGNQLPRVDREYQSSRLRYSQCKIWKDTDSTHRRLEWEEVERKAQVSYETLRPLAEPPAGAHFVEKIYSSTKDEGWKTHESNNLWIKTAVTAFAEHLPMCWKPDHILNLLVTGFGHWLNEFDGHKRIPFEKKTLVIELGSKDWDGAIMKLARELTSQIPQPIRDILLASFSTTTTEMSLAHALTVARACKNFVDIRFLTACGISSVILDGTVDDWRSLKLVANAIEAASQGELSPWISLVQRALDLCVDSFGEQTPELKACWENVINPKSGSGHHSTRGWINVFFPFTRRARWDFAAEKMVYYFGKNSVVWESSWELMNTEVSKWIPDPQGSICLVENPQWFATPYSWFPDTINRQVYSWADQGEAKKVAISAGLVAMIQWSYNNALEPFMSFQVDLHKKE